MIATKETWLILLAAGQGDRFKSDKQKTTKQFLVWKNRPLFWHSVKAFALSKKITGILFVFSEEEKEKQKEEIASLHEQEGCTFSYKIVAGGAQRQDSVMQGLLALPETCELVCIHDSARPFIDEELCANMIEYFEENNCKALIPIRPITDTVKKIDENGLVLSTLERESLVTVQTPQIFKKNIILEAHTYIKENNIAVTDDAAAVEYIAKVDTFLGLEKNKKITYASDVESMQEAKVTVTGFGYDVHRFGGTRQMVLGGVVIPKAPTIEAHSDGDVLLHALADAILGTFNGGDIGEHFPDNKEEFDNIASSILVKEVLILAKKKKREIIHVDLTVVMQTPKIGPHKKLIAKSIARLLEIDEACVNLKATTEEKLGFTGEKKGIKAIACVSALRPANMY